VFLSASIGIALGRDGAMSGSALLRDADAAMYGAKERGRSRYAIYDGAMRLRGAERLETETALRRAIERGELRLHYQPEVDLATAVPSASRPSCAGHTRSAVSLRPGSSFPSPRRPG